MLDIVHSMPLYMKSFGMHVFAAFMHTMMLSHSLLFEFCELYRFTTSFCNYFDYRVSSSKLYSFITFFAITLTVEFNPLA